MDSGSDHEWTEQQSPSVVTMSSAAVSESQYAQQLVQTYFRMLTVGCKGLSHFSSEPETSSSSSLARCSSAYCKSNDSSSRALAHRISPTDAAILSVYLATQAPIPLCIPLASYFPVPQQQEEARPETDEDQEELTADQTYSTPRRRLSSAVELDLAFNINSHGKSEARRPLDGRRLSLPKQKLLDAIKKSFPGIAHRKQREVDLSNNNCSSAAGL
ncbi:hypothetical protein Gpo141_00009799 [Globisporangium polare]